MTCALGALIRCCSCWWVDTSLPLHRLHRATNDTSSSCCTLSDYPNLLTCGNLKAMSPHTAPPRGADIQRGSGLSTTSLTRTPSYSNTAAPAQPTPSTENCTAQRRMAISQHSAVSVVGVSLALNQQTGFLQSCITATVAVAGYQVEHLVATSRSGTLVDTYSTHRFACHR